MPAWQNNYPSRFNESDVTHHLLIKCSYGGRENWPQLTKVISHTCDDNVECHRVECVTGKSCGYPTGTGFSSKHPRLSHTCENPEMTLEPVIFHIALDADIEKYQTNGEYRCASLESDGFIHCCDPGQLDGVVSRYYQNVDEVQLMLLDPDKLSSPLIRENTVGGSELFPHVYGAINTEAVKSIVPFGLFSAERMGFGA